MIRLTNAVVFLKELRCFIDHLHNLNDCQTCSSFNNIWLQTLDRFIFQHFWYGVSVTMVIEFVRVCIVQYNVLLQYKKNISTCQLLLPKTLRNFAYYLLLARKC